MEKEMRMRCDINLRQLEVLVAIVECGSFTAAARQLYLAQSTVSSHIRALENTLHIVLFQRGTKKKIVLTAEGKRVYQHAKEILEKCMSMEEDVTEDFHRTLTIGTSSAPSCGLLPDLVVRFSRAYPEYCCTICAGDSGETHQMLLDGNVQIGFVGSSDNRKSLVYEPVAEDHLVMITPNTPYYRGLQKQGILGKEMLDEPMVLREQGSGTQRMVDNYLTDIGADKLHVTAYVTNPDVLKELVSLGLGVSIISQLSVQGMVENGRVLQFELDTIPMYRKIYLVYRENGKLGEPAKRFLRFVHDQTRERTGLIEKGKE